MSAAASEPSARRGLALWATLLFLGLFALYHANLTVMDEGDAVPSATLPYVLFQTGGLAFEPERFPELFKWKSSPPLPVLDDFFFVSPVEQIGDRTAEDWKRTGNLVFNGPRYYIVPSKIPGEFVSTFGPIPGLLATPFALPFYLVDHALPYKLSLKTSVAKLCAASMVAACAVMIFLLAARRVGRARALALALLYGAGTCAWAVSSQNLWQQTVNQLFLTAGAFFLLGEKGRRPAALSGFFFGAAVACRATGILALGLAALQILTRKDRSLVPFLAGAALAPLALAAYNVHYFGSPLALPQEIVGHAIALQKTGSADLWQTPFLEGAAGLFASPSRGLLVFSPLLVASLAGMVLAFLRREHHELRPLALSALWMMGLQCKWFDWWGGWTYGYRPWLDAVPYLVLLFLPIVEPMTRTPLRRAVCGALFAWSFAVQGLGALTYDRSWNTRRIFITRVPDERRPHPFLEEPAAIAYAEQHGGQYLGPSLCDVDLTFCRYRLWSLEDNIIWYFFTHYSETRGRRLPMSWDRLGK